MYYIEIRRKQLLCVFKSLRLLMSRVKYLFIQNKNRSKYFLSRKFKQNVEYYKKMHIRDRKRTEPN